MENSTKTSTQKPFLKALFVGLLTLGLLIPLIFVNFLVDERSHRKDQVVREISNQWSNEQVVSALKIKIPYTKEVVRKVNGKNEKQTEEGTVYWSPSKQVISGTVTPQIKKKSIYQAILYTADLQIEGVFNAFVKEKGLQYQFAQAEVLVELSDFRGLQNEVVVDFDGQKLTMQSYHPDYMSQKLGTWDPSKKEKKFKLSLSIKGSSKLSFIPAAANTEVMLNSTWKDPGFFGAFLPTHEITKDGFKATWRVLELNRSLPQANNSLRQGTAAVVYEGSYAPSRLTEASGEMKYAFGVNLVEVANNYQKNERASKYGILIIALTFLAFYFIEMFFNKKVNLIQYLLIGLGLVVFYTLLLSFSEYIIFNGAYALSGTMTIGLIVLFAKSLFSQWRPAVIVGGILAILYGFIFTIIQLEDTALLVGSVGLFVILAITMYVSRVIRWE